MCFPPEGSDKITDLLPNNPDELYKDEHGDIRYYGKNPNNYVSFNNELWRIIGVIDGKIKIVRNELLPSVTTDNGVKIGTSDGFYWNSQQQFLKYYNTWEGTTLQTYLNGTYYNSINSIYKKMISEETYYLGGPSWENWDFLTASGYYDIERSDAVYSGNSTIKQNIGLIYPSDYGYAAGNSCLSTYLYNYDSNCKDSDYLFSGVNEWLQSPTSNTSNFSDTIANTGNVVPQVVNSDSLAVRPTLYLNSNVQITGGDGSQSNPFQISL